MTDVLIKQKPLDNEIEQAGYFYSRERRKSLFNPVLKLFRTFTLDESATIAADQMPTTTEVLTLKTSIVFETGTSEGLIFEFGSSSAGIAAWITNTGFGFTAGSGVASANDNVTGTYTIPGALTWADGENAEFVFAVHPYIGKIECWLDGNLVIQTRAVDGILLNAAWSDAGDGSYGNIVNGTINLNVPAGQRIAPSNFVIQEPLQIYGDQLPNQFDLYTSGVDADLLREDFSIDPGWTEVGTISVTGGEVISTTTGGSEDYLESPIFPDETEIWGECDLSIDTGYDISTGGHQSSIFSFLDGGTPLVALQFYNNFGSFEFRAIYRGDGGNNASTIATPTPTLGQTYKITMRSKQNSGVDVLDGIRELWINEVKVLSISNLDDDIRLIDRIRIGNHTTGASASGTTRFDNLKIGTTGTPPIQ